MKLYTALDEFSRPEHGCVATVGNFDGVHLGHQTIITRARELAQAHGLPLVALTFDPPPMKLLRPDKSPRVISPIQVKTKLLAEQGLDALVIVEPTLAFLAQSPEQFAQRVLREQLAARYVVEGQTFSFGQRRAGTLVSLETLGKELGFRAELVPARTMTGDSGGVAVSSTMVRQHVVTGELEKAQQCLGRCFALTGKIVPGRGHGCELGFPTANLQFYSPDQLVPEDGVFVGSARLGDDFESAWACDIAHPAAVSIGRCQTFPDGQWQTEAFLLDYDSDSPSLYDRHIVLSFLARIRPQERFESPAALQQAIANDCAEVRRRMSAT